MSKLHRIDGGQTIRKADVVFVHGLGGDWSTTWRHGLDDSTSWPHWLATDFPEAAVWSLGYAASPTKWLRFWPGSTRDAGHAMALPDRALQVLNLMVQRGLGQRPLLFIGHSLGGLVVKQILRTSADAAGPDRTIFTNTRAVLFLATPHAGAQLASLANQFRTVFGATVSMEDLRAHDAHLRNLLDWYRNHTIAPEIRTVTYFEARAVRGVTIVNPTSAHPGVGSDPVALDEDHLSIAKPRERDAQVCGAAAMLLRDWVLQTPPTAQPHPPPPPQTEPITPPRQPAPPLTSIPDHPRPLAMSETPPPFEMPAAAGAFVGRGAELKDLAERLRAGQNTAVVGPAGMGKTALAAAALHLVVPARGSLQASPFPDGVIYLDLYQLHGVVEEAFGLLANRLRGGSFLSKSPARDRAVEATRGRKLLLVVEGGEEANGLEGRAGVRELLDVLPPESCWLLLTRLSTQSEALETVYLRETLGPEEAAHLFDKLTRGRIKGTLRDRTLKLLDGHPLALTWAGNLMAREEEDPEVLIGDWESGRLPALNDPRHAQHTLGWLFERSTRSLDPVAKLALEAAGLLAHAPFPAAAILAVLRAAGHSDDVGRKTLRSLAQLNLLRTIEGDRRQFTHVLAYQFARKQRGSNAGTRAQLGQWLHSEIEKALRTSDPGSAVDPALSHLQALLRADEESILWKPLVNGCLYAFHDRLVDLGRLGQTKLMLEAVGEWLSGLLENGAKTLFWQREKSICRMFSADVLLNQGDLDAALQEYRAGLDISEYLANLDPSNVGRQSDVSVAQDRIGDVLRGQGDLKAALTSYRAALAAREKLATLDNFSADSQRAVSVSRNKIGDILLTQGDLTGALAFYQASLGIRESLAQSDPQNVLWQRDLSVSQERIGEALRGKGDLAGALEWYRKSLRTRESLAEYDTSNMGYKRDASVSLNKIGDVLFAQGDRAGALTSYQADLKLTELLATSDPLNAGWQRDLSVSRDRVANVLFDQGDFEGASVSYQAGLEVRERLAQSDPSNAGWHHDLSISHDKVGDVLFAQRDLNGSLSSYQASLQIREATARSDPSNAVWQRNLHLIRIKIGDVLAAQGDRIGALSSYRLGLIGLESLVSTDPMNAGWQRDLSWSFTKLAQLSEGTEALQFAERSLALDQRLAALDPTNATWQTAVEVGQRLVERLRTGAHAGA